MIAMLKSNGRGIALAMAAVLFVPGMTEARAGDPETQLAQANSANALNGEWVGRYLYGDNNQQVSFFASLRAGSGGFRGWIVEPNTFGSGTERYLSANVTGTISADGRVEFVKTYDGTGGQTHAVYYLGQIGGDGAIRGQWTIPPNSRGGFTLQPVPR